MSGFEESVAVEAIKPAAGFINAILGPKIEKLKLWANEQDLKGKIDIDSLSKIMNGYLIKLSDRVSEITSIPFSQEKLSIFDAYEPLKLNRFSDHRDNNQEIDTSYLLSGNNKSIVIIDNAGMGKSTFSKYIVTKLLFKSDRIPIFFELRKINQKLSLIGNLVSELDSPGYLFDRNIFYRLLQLGKFYIIIDGFDEVSLDFQHELANQIHELSIKGGHNSFILTTRPQSFTPNIVNGTSLKFMDFTVDQATSLLSRYDKISNLDIGHRLINIIEKVPDKFLESPLLVSLLYKTFGFNNSIATRLSTFYSELYDALYKGHDLLNKNGYTREKKSKLDFETFRKLLRTLCYYMMINRKSSLNSWSEAIEFIEKAASTSSITPTSSDNFLDDLMTSVPLIQNEGDEYKFFHKTILEYFSAEYIIFHKNSSKTLSKVFESKLAPSFDKTFEFVADINSSLFNSIITKPFAIAAKNLSFSNDHYCQDLITLSFLSTSKIGLWPVKEYTKVNSNNITPSFDIELTHIDYSYTGTLVRTITINDVDYYFVITWLKKHNNLHRNSWLTISEKTLITDNNIEVYDNHSELVNALGVNNWLDINNENIEKLSRTHEAISHIHHALRHVINNDDGEIRHISENKVNEVLHSLSIEDDFEIEIDGLM